MEDYLRYGDLVYLSTSDEFYLKTHGFISTNLIMDPESESDFFPSIFRIFPQTINSNQIELTSLAASNIDGFEDSVIRLKESAEGEIKTNMQIYQNFKEQSIKFGSLIQLQHFSSGKFICLEPRENAEFEKDNLKVLVKDFVSDYSQIRISQAYKYQKEGNAWIRSNDSVYLEFSIQGTNKTGYMHESQPLEDGCKEVNCCFDIKTLWRLKLYSPVQDPELLITGDYIWLYHTEIGSCVIKQGSDLLFSKSTHDSNGIWKIEGDDNKVGAVAKAGEPYRIKHLCSGMYLSLKTDFRKGKTKSRPVLSASKDSFSLWKFVHAYKKKKMVEKSHLYSLLNCETNALLDCRIGKEAPVLKNVESETAYFKIMKCEEEDLKQTQMILNCVLPVKEFNTFLKNLDLENINFRTFLRISSTLMLCLEQLEKYMNNELIGFVNFQKQFGQIQADRQRSLKEQKFIKTLTSILKNYRPELLVSRSLNQELLSLMNKKLLDCVGKVFDILALIVQKNPINQSLAFEHINIYKQHVNTVNSCTTLLLAVVENNQNLIFSLSKPPSSLIQHYTWLLRINGQNRKPHLVYFLEKICDYLGSGVKLTQERIHEHLFLNPETFRKAVITTIAHLDTLSIIIPGEASEVEILLNDCFSQGDCLDIYRVQISYFINMLDLFSNMCKDRNYTCKSSIKDWFPVDILLNYIWNSDMSAEIRASFVRLMLNMYVDSHPRHEEKFPESVKVLKLQEVEDSSQKFKDLFSLDASDVNVFGMLRSKATFSAYQKKKKHEEQGEVVFEGEELTLYRLKEDLIKFMVDECQFPNHNVLLFELIKLAHQLVKLKIITNCRSVPSNNSAIISPYHPMYNYEELDLTRLIRALINLMIFDKSSELRMSNKTDKISVKGKKILPEISEVIFEKADPSPMKEYLKTYSNHIKKKVSQLVQDTSFKTLSKIEVCKLLDYILSWRLDFLVNNVIEWFNGVSKSPSDEDFSVLFPPIGSKNSKFVVYKTPEVKDLSFYNSSIVNELLVQFVLNNDYDFRTIIIALISKTSEIRSKMLKEINNIQIVTTVETSEMFIWVKNSIKIVKQISEQSELWLNYWSQTGDMRQKNMQKVSILQKVIDEIDTALDNGSRLKGQELVSRKTGVIDKSRQKTFFNMYISDIIILLFQDSMLSISELSAPSASPQQREAREKFLGIIRSCYKLLSDLTRDNKKIQETLYKDISIFMSYIHIPSGQIELICNIFKGNSKICKMIDLKFLTTFTDLIFKYGRQAKFLEIFKHIQGKEDDFFPENQRLVVKVLLEQDYHFLCFMSPGKQNRFDFESSKHPNQDFHDEPFTYHAKLLEVLAITSWGSSGVYLTEIKCQKLLNVDYIFELLEKGNEPGYCELFTSLLSFFYNAYLDTEKVNENLMNYSKLVSFVSSQTSLLSHKDILSDKEISDLRLILDILIKYLNNYALGSFIYDTFDTFQKYLEALNEKYDQIRESPLKIKVLEKLEILGKKYEIDFPSQFFEDIHEASSGSRSMNKIKSAWFDFKQNILYNDNLRMLLKEEKKEIVNVIINISKYNSSVSPSHVITALLEYINNFTFHKPKVSLLNKTLKILIYFLSHIPEGSEDLLTQIKQHLNENGIVRTVMALLCDSDINSDTFIYLLQLSCVVLDEGDQEFQTSFFNYFTLNQSSQIFFQRICNYFLTYISSSRTRWDKRVLIYKEHFSACETLLRFLQLLCENHNSQLQNYLRYQDKARQSFNIILSIVTLLEELLKKCRDFDFAVISQCFDSLTEFIQGPCKKNQIALVDSKFLEISSRLLSFDEASDNLAKYHLLKEEMLSSAGSRDAFSSECLSGWMISHLKYKCMITLLSLLEGQTDGYVITRMIRSLNIEILKENIISFYHAYTLMYPPDYYDHDIFEHYAENKNYHPKKDSDHLDRPEYYQLIIEVGFMVYHLMCHFKDNEDPENKRIVMNELPELAVGDMQQGFMGTKLLSNLGKFGLDLFKSSLKRVRKMVKSKEKKIEEIDKAKILKNAYAFFQKHSGNLEIIFQGDIFRIYFWIRPEGHFITEEMKDDFHFRVERSSHKAKVQFLLKEANKIIEEMIYESKLSKLLKKNFIVNLVASYVSVWKELAFAITIGLNVLIIMSYFSNDASTEAIMYDLQYEGTTKSIISLLGSIQMACSCAIVAFFLIKTAPILIARGWKERNWQTESRFWLIKMINKTKNGILTVYFALNNTHVLYQLCYLVFSILGTAAHHLFFAFHLLDILYRYPTLQNVVKAIIIPRRTLALAFLFILVISYLYSIWAFLSFGSDFKGDCWSLSRCFKVNFDEGLKCGGGIGDWLNNCESGADTGERLLFDSLFFLMIPHIMRSVLQGIISDTFAILREENDINTADRENRCFICSLEIEFIEYATERPFKYHTTFEHCEWNYILFINYLQNKEASERTGLESYLHELIASDDSSWIPMYRSLSIRKHFEEENELKKKMGLIEEIYNSLDKEMKETKRLMAQYFEAQKGLDNN